MRKSDKKQVLRFLDGKGPSHALCAHLRVNHVRDNACTSPSSPPGLGVSYDFLRDGKEWVQDYAVVHRLSEAHALFGVLRTSPCDPFTPPRP